MHEPAHPLLYTEDMTLIETYRTVLRTIQSACTWATLQATPDTATAALALIQDHTRAVLSLRTYYKTSDIPTLVECLNPSVLTLKQATYLRSLYSEEPPHA